MITCKASMITCKASSVAQKCGVSTADSARIPGWITSAFPWALACVLGPFVAQHRLAPPLGFRAVNVPNKVTGGRSLDWEAP